MQNIISRELSDCGLHIRAVPTTRLSELAAEFESLHEKAMISDKLHTYLGRRFRLDGNVPEGMKTIFTVAMPAPIGSVVMNNTGRKLTTPIPPTYMDYGRVPPAIESTLNSILGKYDYSAVWGRQLPEKLLAARSGLARYGKNNICYVEGLGSFAFLSSYYTDMPCEDDAWGEVHRMEACKSCTKCVDNCPTGAIKQDRRVIDADRCLTMHNEEDSSIPFPGWIAPQAHNSLIGCMMCQTVCPMNRAYLDNILEPVEFNETETALLLAGKPLNELPQEMIKKMESINMNQYFEPMARNIKALFNKL